MEYHFGAKNITTPETKVDCGECVKTSKIWDIATALKSEQVWMWQMWCKFHLEIPFEKTSRRVSFRSEV